MWAGTPQEYEAADGSVTTVAAFEHTMILTGYGSDSVQLVDAYTGQYQTYWLTTFLKSWGVLGNMAIFGSSVVHNTDEPAPQKQAGTYTVQPGDYLVALAERFGTAWQELAQLNSIPYPFTIFTGQVLQFPIIEEPQAEPDPEPTPEPTPPSAEGIEPNYRAVLPVIQRSYVLITPSFQCAKPGACRDTEAQTLLTSAHCWS
jgi:LysM repeat protein